MEESLSTFASSEVMRHWVINCLYCLPQMDKRLFNQDDWYIREDYWVFNRNHSPCLNLIGFSLLCSSSIQLDFNFCHVIVCLRLIYHVFRQTYLVHLDRRPFWVRLHEKRCACAWFFLRKPWTQDIHQPKTQILTIGLYAWSQNRPIPIDDNFNGQMKNMEHMCTTAAIFNYSNKVIN